jgi:hypothetical protein
MDVRMNSRAVKIVGATLFCVFFALAFQLRQRDLEFMIEPDFNWQLIEAWRNFLTSLNLNYLPMPYPHVYLDGQFIIYAIAEVPLRSVAASLVFSQSAFPNDVSFALGAALLINIAAYAGACTIFFAACWRLSRRILIAGLMTVALFLAPQMLDINIGRVDYFNTLPLMAIFYCSCVLALGEERQRHAIVLGVAMAFAATIKINGLFFGIFPAVATLTCFRFGLTTIARLARFAALSFIIFLVVYMVLMSRYIYYFSPFGIFSYYRASIAFEMQWASVLVGPRLYYNIDLLRSAGIPFIVLYLLCATFVVALAVRSQSRAATFLSLCFVVLSLAGILTQKYPRGGYHLLPVYFAMIAITASEILKQGGHRVIRYALLSAGGAALGATLGLSTSNYVSVAVERRAEEIGIADLKRAPRDWLHDHVAPGTTICIQTGSTWTLPPLDAFKVVNGPFALPYLDLAALAQTMPPKVEDVGRLCSLVITSDWHRAVFDDQLEQASPLTEARWLAFFKELDSRYPPMTFSSTVAIPAKKVFVNDLRSE